MPHFIDVILPLPLQKRFTYAIDEAEAAFLKQGMRVAVPFGKSKVYTAIVAKIHQTPPQVYEAKPINQILDKQALVTTQQLAFGAGSRLIICAQKGMFLKLPCPELSYWKVKVWYN